MPFVSHPNNKNPKKQDYFSSSWLYLHTSSPPNQPSQSGRPS